ncbi:MAG: transposase [Cyanobacteria bacterium P01_F01_bin.150]
MRTFYVDKHPAKDVAAKFGYTLSTFYSLTKEFRATLIQAHPEDHYFIHPQLGVKSKFEGTQTEQLIIELRKKSLSVIDIKSILDALGHKISQRSIANIMTRNGFKRLERRSRQERSENKNSVQLNAPISQTLSYAPEEFSSTHGIGILCLLPYLDHYGINTLITNSTYPETEQLNRVSSILSFVALKGSNIRRYSHDNGWCMDRGLGLFVGLNVLPKAAWCSSYSHRVIRPMNQAFLKALHQCWSKHNLLGGTANLDVVSIPYREDESLLENNWSGSRNKSINSILAVLAQEPDRGLITYGDTTIRHKTQFQVAVEFLDFYQEGDSHNILKYLVFDSKFTTYENLRKLEDNDKPIKFMTIRRRGKKIIDELNALSSSEWKEVRIKGEDNKTRYMQIYEQKIVLKGYGKEVQQIAILGSGRIQPALLITNDFDYPAVEIIRKYSQRWLIETEIAEQVYFFHLNQLSSSIVIKVNFDLTMSILTHNLFRLFAAYISGFTHQAAPSLFNNFLDNSGRVIIDETQVTIILNKKRNIPALLNTMEPFQGKPLASINNLKFRVIADSTS